MALDAQLFNAAYDGRIDDVQRLLKEGADVHWAHKDGATPLFAAAQQGHDAVVKMLVGANAAVDQAINDAVTPLYIAAQQGHDAVVKTLLGANAAVNQAMSDGGTPLFIAAYNGHDVIVKMLLEANAAVNQAMNDDDSPLCAASRRGHPTTVQILLDAGADVDKSVNASFVDGDVQLLGGSTSLFAAALIGHEEVCRVLLRANANIHASDSSGQTALTAAVRGGHESIVRLLLDAGASLDDRHQNLTAQAIAIENKHVTVATVLNDAERLVLAVTDADLANVQALLDAGASPNLTDQTGDRLLHLALRGGEARLSNATRLVPYELQKAEILEGQLLDKLLRAPGVDLTARNTSNDTPVVLAIKLRQRHIPHKIYHAIHHVTQHVPDEDIVVDHSRPLGQGGNGFVHAGSFQNQLVAVKTAHTSGADALRVEIHAMQTCNSPYLLELKAVSGQDSDNPKLVLEYMDGGNLRQYLDKKRKGEPTEVDYSTLDIAWVIANGLADLHRNGFMHRDLKSLNVLLSSTNYIKVADFGLTKEFHLDMTTFVGTPAWIAPEVFASGATYDYAADIYAFGVILTELETLQVPYAGMNLFAIIDGVRSGELRPSVSADCAPWYKALADDCLSFDPKQRPTAQTIIDRLLLQEKALATREPVAAPETKTERLMTPPQLTKGMSSSSSTSSTSSSWSSGALTSRLPCRMCKTRNAALNQHCSCCNEAMPNESTKLALLLKRAKVANAKGFSINLCIDCDICETTNIMTAPTCIDPECGEELLDDAEKLRILARRFDLATNAA